MVNRGRSGGCLTCKRRRVKCDETKPQCKSCQRLKLCCGGYSSPRPVKLKFKDQNHKFAPKSQTQAQSQLQRQPCPDTAVDFYLGHYASMGRDMGSTRGFFELLIPCFVSQSPQSVLSLTVSVLASETLARWRHDPSSFRSPRQSYVRAITRLRAAVQDPSERTQPATVLAVLVLQTYENVSAIYGGRWACTTHHNGASSLLLALASNDMDIKMRTYLRRFMLHTEVSSAMRQRRPLNTIALTWINDDTEAVPENPSSSLDAIGAAFAQLQAPYTQIKQAAQSCSVVFRQRLLSDWTTEADVIDSRLLNWADNVPSNWHPQRLISGRDVDASIPTYQSVCESYPSCQIASIWNLWRFQRLRLAAMKLDLLCRVSSATTSKADDPAYLTCQQTIQKTVDAMCYSIPFYLGNRTATSSLSDFTDPTIQLTTHANHASHDDHRRHVIAQGPWRAMHPLSGLVTFLSEHEDVVKGMVPPEQRDWIRNQFLRVATLLRLPGSEGQSRKQPGSCKNDLAKNVARQIRKGAILMSGP